MRECCRLVDSMWGDETVWLESLALNPLVCLFDNPYGKPVCKSQLVFFREDQNFSLALLEGVCIAKLMNPELRWALDKW